MPAAPSLIEHLETFLGRIEAGWSTDADGLPVPFQVVRSSPGSLPGCTAFSTLGLSATPLPSRRSGKAVRQELVMLVPDSLRSGPVPDLLQQVGREVLASGTALLRGDVLGPRGPLFEGSQTEALYASVPVYLPDGFAQLGEVVFVWLLPVSRTEAALVATTGWPAFEDLVAAVDPDLIDVFRPPVVP